MSDYKIKTARAFWAPKPGMLFHEVYSFWMYVVDVTDDIVTTLESGAPCTFPDGDSIKAWRGTVDEFSERWSYKGTTIGFMVTLADEGRNVRGWADHAERLLGEHHTAHASGL